jgi:hypothetical protein
MLLFVVFVLASFSSAQYSIDISGLKTDDYSLGEEISFRVILLEEGKLVNQEVVVSMWDALENKEINRTIPSNQEIKIKVENDFPSGIWVIRASYLDAEIKRNFVIGENFEVEFSIEGDELTIKNIGNVRYTKAVQIKIGDKTNTYVQNIGVGEEKILKLVSPEGIYNIEINDGKTTLKRGNVQLYGTGNVVGAVRKDLVGYTGFAGVGKLDSSEDERFFSLNKLPLALIFIGVVGILVVLAIIERRLSKKVKKKSRK